MSQVSRFAKLPLEVQARVERRLVANGFSDYRAICEDLRRGGYRISKSALARHGQELKARLRAARDAHLIDEAKQ